MVGPRPGLESPLPSSLSWTWLDDPAAPVQGEPGVVVLGPGLAPGDWLEARARWPTAWLVEGPAGSAAPAAGGVDALRAALDGAPLAALALDAGGGILWANPAVARLLGRASVAELQGAAEGLVAPASTGADLPDRGNRARRADGSALAVRVIGWRLGDGPDAALALALRDASEESRARDELARAAWYHRALVKNAHDSITIVDADGIVRYQSPASHALLGLSPEELVGAPLRLAFAEDRLRARQVLARVAEAPGRSERLLYRTYDAEGRLHWLEGLISNHLDNPMVGGLVLNSRDVTERRALERGLRDADRMRVAGLLGATVAHDMNNMIAIVAAGLDALEPAGASGPGATEEEAKARVAAMREAMARSSEMARRLMAIGRRGTGEVERVDLGRVVRRLQGLLEPLLRQGQELELEVAPGEHPVLVEVGDLEQAVVNLVVNARDALGPQGRVSVRVERRPGGSPPRVALVVEDDGAGMDEQTLARMFEPFFSTKGPERGTGLGMVVVQGFAREAGGEVDVRSALGRGTRIELVLPIAVEPVATGVGRA